MCDWFASDSMPYPRHEREVKVGVLETPYSKTQKITKPGKNELIGNSRVVYGNGRERVFSVVHDVCNPNLVITQING